jgi:hypothetical protein
VYFANSTTGGIRLGTTSGSTLVIPCNETGATEDAVHDLGYSSARWRNLYMSGIIYGSDTSGNPVGNHNPGYMLHPTNGSHFMRDGGNPVRIGRDATNGNLTEYYRQGAHVGSIGVADGDNIYIASDDTNDVGLKFNGDGNRITPCNALGADRGSAIDLGEAGSGLFKDLYLSGGIQFDARSNKLDDYEEGTWTPSILVENAAAASITVNHASYTKIGRLVSLVFDVTINSVTGTNSSRAIQLEGMPFTINTASGGGPNIAYTNLTNSMTGSLALQGRFNTRYRIVNLNGATGLNASDHLQVNTVLRGQFTYHTDQ